MLHVCPHCKRKRRSIQAIRVINKKKYWAFICVDCKLIMDLEDFTDSKAKKK